MVGIKRNAMTSWLKQRISALVMLIITLVFAAICVRFYFVGDIVTWQHLCKNTLVRVILQIFFVMLVMHTTVGMADIYMDYIKCSILRFILRVLTWTWLIICLVFSINIIWS